MTISNTGNFCTACGNKLLETAVICPKCGSPTAKFHTRNVVQSQPLIPPVYNATPKSKTTAVVLAFFLGIWSYLYTYKRDANAFWVSFFIPPVLAMFLLATSLGRIQGWQTLLVLGAAAFLALTAIVKQNNRTDEWFATYPHNNSPRQ
jgi:hypothetical protein